MRRLLFSLLLLDACGGGSGPVTPPPPPPPPPPPAPAPVASVTVSRDTATLVPRQTLQLSAVTKDQNGAVLSGRTVTWASTAGATATVSSDGLVTAAAAGAASISATSEGKSGATAVTVKDGAVIIASGGLAATADSAARVTVPPGALAADQAITIAPVLNPLPNPRLIGGTAYDFGPTMTFALAVTLKISYAGSTVPASADQTRLRIHRLTGGAWVEVVGSTVDVAGKTVSAPTSSFSTYAIVELAPVPVATVTMTQDTATLVPQQTIQLIPVLKDQTGAVLTGRTVTWGSSAGTVATVSIDGVVTAVAAGTTTVTATSEGQNGIATITVKDGAVVSPAGGTASTAGGAVLVTFPAGALTTAKTITIAPAVNPPANPLLVPGTAFDFGPSGTFAQPVTITISYAGTTVPAAVDPATLRLHRLTAGVWVALPGSTVNVSTKTVTGQTTSFSTYAVLSVPVTPAGSGILFQTDRDGNAEVYRMNPDGSGQTRITNALGFDGEARWSPDGTRIVYTKGTDIYTMNADGTNITRLTTDPGADSQPAWSHDGSMITFVASRGGNIGIWVMNSDGSNQHRLTGAGFDEHPAWSPDGTKIAFSTGSGAVYVVNSDGTNLVNLTTGTDFAGGPAWSPDGTRIAYSGYFHSLDQFHGDIYVMNADGSGKSRLTTDIGSEAAPAWSPDGSQIAFVRLVGNSNTNIQIFVIGSGGGGGTNISNHSGINSAPAWARP